MTLRYRVGASSARVTCGLRTASWRSTCVIYTPALIDDPDLAAGFPGIKAEMMTFITSTKTLCSHLDAELQINSGLNTFQHGRR